MNDWEKEIAAAMAREGGAQPSPNEHEQVVDEVLRAVNKSDYFRAAYRSEVIGNLLRLNVVTYPRRHPAERSIMIPIAVSGAGYVSVPRPAGMGYLDDPSAEGLRRYLIDFIKSPAFQGTLRHYKARNDESVQAWMKYADRSKVDLADQALLVEPDQQDRLVDAFEAQKDEVVEFTGLLLSPVGNFKAYDPGRKYRFVDSGGFVMSEIEHEPVEGSGDRVTIRGRPDLTLAWLAHADSPKG